ncbi:NAD-dependent epimerase/dehydratase family protein [Anaerolineae bacterium CFX9]|nr:NAD-dependent epimerase/dehydratase family protein [Anaerolineae bacterium CFX9]
MDILLIGGTRFSGRAMVEIAQARGHRVTVFHRGQSNPGIHANAEEILGDRDHDLAKLDDRRWDAVIDTCGYVPRSVGLAVDALKDRVGHYTFISTISVYEDGIPAGSDESAPLKVLADPAVEEVTGETYGGLKVLCEQRVEAAFPGRALLPRPGLIVGPNDPTERFPYWVERVSRGGEVFVPGDPARQTQMIDARDLAAWVIDAVEQGRTGAYNLTGPAQPLTWAAWMETLRQVTGSDAVFTYGDDAFIESLGEQRPNLPFYVPAAYSGIMAISIQKALAAGLTHRPLAETARDTLHWIETRPEGRAIAGAMPSERETELLTALKR